MPGLQDDDNASREWERVKVQISFCQENEVCIFSLNFWGYSCNNNK